MTNQTTPLMHNGKEITRVSTKLGFSDRLGSWKARWGIGRMHYLVKPELYAVGNPDQESPVLVTANYKMSFDRVRSQLTGCNAWILVLDTQGVNVWCAAGKGMFGTEELIRRLQITQLAEIVSHGTLIVPQLGAPGICAHQVKELSGFRVIFGPVRAADIPAFLAAGNKATPKMRQVFFPLQERAVLIPLELAGSLKYALIIIMVFFLLSGLGRAGYSLARAEKIGLHSLFLFLLAYGAGTVLTPLLLPWLPGRAFSAKGAWAGLISVAVAASYSVFQPSLFPNWFNALAWLLLIPSLASFLGMNFTGASNYTSLSGVKREMRYAVPLQIVGAISGLALWLVGQFI